MVTLPEVKPGSPTLTPSFLCLPAFLVPVSLDSARPMPSLHPDPEGGQPGVFPAGALGEAVVLELSLEWAQSGILPWLPGLRSQPAQHRGPLPVIIHASLAWAQDAQRLGVEGRMPELVGQALKKQEVS